MNKQKQIEEMCRDVVPFLVKEEFVEEILKDPLAHFTATSLKEYVELFEEMIRLNYRKILEGEVVLTREEYEKLKLFEERVRSGVCFTQKEWFDYCQKDSNERTSLLIKAKKDTRKETAEKLLDEIDYESNGQTKSITDLLRKKYGV